MAAPIFSGCRITMNLTGRDGSWVSPILALGVPLLACWAPVVTSAQEDVAALETLVVTGTRVPDRVDLPRASTVLDGITIAARNDGNVLDLLSDVPGVHVNLPGSRGNVGEVFLRGGEPNFTSVLIDGVQVNDPTNTRGGSFDFSTLNIDDIERVEVLRGPSSAIYGSDALSGTINIITRSGTSAFSGEVDAEIGSDNYERAGLRLGGPVTQSGRYSVGVGLIEDGNSSSADRFDGNSVTGKLDLAQDSPTRVSIYARHTDADSSGFPDASGGPEFAVIRDMTQRESEDNSVSFALTSQLSERSNLHLAATHFDHGERTRSPGVAPGIGAGIPANRSDSDFTRDTVNIFYGSTVSSQLDLAVGLGYQNEDGESVGEIELAPELVLPTQYTLSRDVVSTYAELGYRSTAGIGVSAGIRSDDADSSGRETTGKISLDYDIFDDRVNVRLGWADAFKLPSLFALADPLVGNPGLRPETANSVELGLVLKSPTSAFSWQITAFKQKFENLIDFDFDTFMTVNRSYVEIDGVEIGGQFNPSREMQFSAHLTYTDIDVLDSATELRQRPELRGGVGLYWTISETLSSHAAWQYIGERFDSSVPTGQQTLPSYSRLDLAVTWKLNNTVRLNLAIDNVADAEYAEAIGFPAVGRRVRISIEKPLGDYNR
jgi:outer membrane cobalamin receptor